MTLNLSMPEHEELKPRITVFGVGGAGGNAVDNMIEKALDGVEFVVANTDAQALQQSNAPQRIQMGVRVTEGLGAGARAAVGAAAAEESIEQIVDELAGAHMCFITAGMGGGTGTGAAPIIAQAARELGVLTVGVVTKPFQFEGPKRMRQAEAGIEALQKVVDTLIIIPNQNLFRLANENTTFTEAFSLADDVLYQGVKGVTDLMVRPGLINLDFADVRAVMDEMGKAMMGTGEATGDNRAKEAAQKAIANPLLDEISLKGAKGVLINITGGHDLTLFELDEAANCIREEVDPDANIIVGSTLDTVMEGGIRVSVVATGIDALDSHGDVPLPRRALSEQSPQQVAVEAAPVEEPTPAEVAYETSHEDVQMEDAPSLFTRMEPEHEVAFEQPEDVFEEETLASDDLPPPAYRPEVAEEQVAPVEIQEDPESFGAPRAPAPGTPSPEAMVRLRHAVHNNSASATEERHPASVAAEARGDGSRRKHMMIDSLIHRMTGRNGEGAEQPKAAAPQPRRQPQMQAAPQPSHEEAADPDQERIEIPAFLRRQAN